MGTRRRSRGLSHDGCSKPCLKPGEEADDESNPGGIDKEPFCNPKSEGSRTSATFLLPDSSVVTSFRKNGEKELGARISEVSMVSERTCIESSLLPFPPCGQSWEWPLSRDEKKTRVLLIDRSVE